MVTQRRIFPFLLVITGALLLIGAAIVVLTSNQPAQPTETPTSLPTEVSLTDIPRVSLSDAKTAFDQKTAIFVDVRDAQSYAASHIPNALSIPLAEIQTRLSELNPDTWIITVCT